MTKEVNDGKTVHSEHSAVHSDFAETPVRPTVEDEIFLRSIFLCVCPYQHNSSLD